MELRYSNAVTPYPCTPSRVPAGKRERAYIAQLSPGDSRNLAPESRAGGRGRGLLYLSGAATCSLETFDALVRLLFWTDRQTGAAYARVTMEGEIDDAHNCMVWIGYIAGGTIQRV